MENKINPADFYDLPLLKLFLLKNKVILRCFIDDIWSNLYYRQFYKKTKKLKNKFKGSALIIANGPRLKDCINFAEKNHREALNADAFCVNNYINHAHILDINPKYYFLTDHAFFSNNINENLVKRDMLENDFSREKVLETYRRARITLKKVLKTPNLKLFIPVEKYSQYNSNPNIFPLSAKLSSAVSNSTDITKTLCWKPLTAYVAISTAIYMGYEKIFLAGFDTDYFKTIEFDRKNSCMKYEYKHFYQDKDDLFLEARIQGNNASSLLSEISSILRINEKTNFINLDPNGIFI